MTSVHLSTCYPLGGLKSLLPTMDNLFNGIPFSHEAKIHEHIEGRQREILPIVCTHFVGFQKELPVESLPFQPEERAD